MADVLPRLTKPQMVRLVEIGTTGWNGISLSPRQTAQLLGLAVIEHYRRHGFNYLRPTPLGIRILAGLPGNEFDRYRSLLEAVHA